MTHFIMMVGIPGSGKSYKASEIYGKMKAEGEEVLLLSSDAIRKELYNNEEDQFHNQQIFKKMHSETLSALKEGVSVIYDATNISLKNRRSILEEIHSVVCLKEAYIMTTSIIDCKKNDMSRKRKVGNEVIEKMAASFQIPFYGEGFDKIHLCGWDDNVIEGNESGFQTVLSMMDNFDQKNIHHKYTLREHCDKSYKLVCQSSSNKILQKSAQLHDIGKIFTGAEKADGNYCYYGHENVGTYNLLNNLNCLNLNNMSDVLECLFYINYHMLPFQWQTEKTKEKYYKIFGEKLYNNLLLLHKCDEEASGTKE